MSTVPRLTMTGVHKRFGPTAALRGVDLELLPGEVHALVGENGAGKSTLMKVLSGAEQPDAGAMALDGVPYAPSGPQDARRRGVAMIYQELTLASHLSVKSADPFCAPPRTSVRARTDGPTPTICQAQGPRRPSIRASMVLKNL